MCNQSKDQESWRPLFCRKMRMHRKIAVQQVINTLKTLYCP